MGILRRPRAHPLAPWALLAIVASGGCGGHPSPEAPRSNPIGPIAAEAAPPASGCELVLEARAAPGPEGSVELVVWAENLTNRGLALELPDRCPHGPIDLVGLPDGYDYYGTCAQGACAGPRKPIRIPLRPGERRDVAATTLPVAGGGCNAPVAAGRYLVQPVAPPLDVRVCVVGAAFELGAGRPRYAPSPPPRYAPSPPPSEEPSSPPRPPGPPGPPRSAAPTADRDVRACSETSDCVLSCPAVRGCCGWSCGCDNAVNRSRVAEFEAEYARACDRTASCPAMGCAYRLSLPVCANGRCTTVGNEAGVVPTPR